MSDTRQIARELVEMSCARNYESNVRAIACALDEAEQRGRHTAFRECAEIAGDMDYSLGAIEQALRARCPEAFVEQPK